MVKQTPSRSHALSVVGSNLMWNNTLYDSEIVVLKMHILPPATRNIFVTIFLEWWSF